MSRHRTGPLTDAFKVISFLGSSAFIIAAVIVIGGLLWWRRRNWRPLLLLAGAYGGSALIYGLVKVLVARSRPPAALAVGHFNGWSFPSGHAMQGLAFYGALAYVVAGGAPGRRRVAWTVAGCLALLIGVSRCYLGAHWPSDVVVGWALGGLWLWGLIALTPLRFRAANEPPGLTPRHERLTAPGGA